jgi:hypothetical protein
LPTRQYDRITVKSYNQKALNGFATQKSGKIKEAEKVYKRFKAAWRYADISAPISLLQDEY